MRSALLVVACGLALASPAAADDAPFRRTTPRAELLLDASGMAIGVPGGRAWGVESALRSFAEPSDVAVRLAVTDPAVREAFVRIAWYARAEGRSRQLRIDDTDPVLAGEDRVVRVILAPPAGAVAYRMRVLARLEPGATRSAGAALRVVRPASEAATPLTRLVLAPALEPYSAE